MKEEEEFDSQIKKKVNTLNNEFNESYWLKAKELIKAERQFKANVWFFSFVLLALIGAIAGMGFFMNNYQHKINLFGTDLSMGMHETLNNKISEAPNGKNTSENNTRKVNISADNKRTVVLNSTKQNIEYTGDLPANKSDIKVNTLRISETIAQSKKESIIRMENPHQNIDPVINNQIASFISGDIIPEINLDLPEAGMQIKEEKDPSLIASKAFDNTLMINLNPDTSNPVKINFHKQFDKRMKQSYFAAEACLTEFNAPLSNLNAMNYGVGMKYYYFYSKNFGVSLGVEYRRVAQQLEARKYYTVGFDFGSTVQTKIINTVRLDYIQIPLSFIYSFNNAHQINVGINFLTLIQTTEKVETQFNGEQHNNTVTKEHGYFNAVNGTDLQLSIGYAFTVSKRLFFMTNFYKGLNDVTSNSVFKSNRTDLNIGMTVGAGLKIH